MIVAEKDDEGSPTDDSEGDDSDGSDSGGEKEITRKESKKEAAGGSKTSSSRKRNNNDDHDSKEEKQKKKKDPNAPKRALSGFMFFSQLERENVKKEIPGILFKDIGIVLGERWNKLSAEEKAPYEAKAQVNKKRYQSELSGYKNPSTVDESDSN